MDTTTASPIADTRAPEPGWLRLHRALMPDYNRKAAAYWWLAVSTGACALLHAVAHVAAMPWRDLAPLAGCVAASMVAGLFPVRIPRSKNSFAAGEIFIFLLLLYGPAAATLAAAGEGLVGACSTSKRWTSRIATPMMAAISMLASGTLLHGIIDAMRGHAIDNAGVLLVVTMASAVLYFALNTALATALPYLKRSQWPVLHEMFSSFGWIGLTFAGSASVACLLFLSLERSGMAVLLGAVPVIVMLLTALHTLFRRQENDEALRASQVAAAEREAEIAARHLAEVEQIAFHDALTGLPNRRRFQEIVTQALGRVHAGGQHFALMFLDFDRFKVINDSLGHAVGDEFLVALSLRIRQMLRPTDIVARLGGDEFAILAEQLDRGRSAEALAQRVLDALRQPLALGGTEIAASASIGITFSNQGYRTMADMLRDADTAMYQAKSAGKARFALFDSALHTRVSERMHLEAALRQALALNQLCVVYQPLVDLRSGSVTGFEALVRWDHPEQGRISPAAFLGVADEAGLMVPLTDFVLRTACAQLRAWQLRDQRFGELSMHVNVSSDDIAHPALLGRIQSALLETGVAPSCLSLELTEGILMERLEVALPVLRELRRLGVGLSIDDFGTGYSSLQHLSSLPADSLKIDRAFVARLQGEGEGGDDATIVRAIVLLGQSLHKRVIAEGIETADQAERLLRLGCTTGQGFHLWRPMDAGRVDEMLEQTIAADAVGAAPLGVQPREMTLLH